MAYKLYHNVAESRFEVRQDNLIAFVTYRLHNNQISFLHTEVPEPLSGKGIGSFLAQNVLKYAQKNQLKVRPYCPFIKDYIDKHEEFQQISMFHQG